jgi:uncharacterized protein (TIGR03790 family)
MEVPSTVLVLVNDAYLPESGTNGLGASVFVGEHYAEIRNIPASNIVHLNIPYAGWQSDGQWHGMEYDGYQFLPYADYLTYIETPVKDYLAQNGLTDKILYVVTTYGVPVMLGDTVWRESIDSLLSIMNSGIKPTAGWETNPYQDTTATGSPAHFAQWVNPRGYKMYLVTRLDGPNAIIAASLVDKAVQAEETLSKSSGVGYFDFVGYSASNSGYYPLDQTMLSAYNTAVNNGITAVLNNQAESGHPIDAGPNSAWVWGWYVPSVTNAYPTPTIGAVGSQATSYTCNSIRDGGLPGDSNWCVYFLLNGFTATWGATGEPYTIGIATGDSLFGHFWRGYNFAEASYLANPFNNWMMVFIGDPLYAPKRFTISGRLPFRPRIAKPFTSSGSPAMGQMPETPASSGRN